MSLEPTPPATTEAPLYIMAKDAISMLKENQWVDSSYLTGRSRAILQRRSNQSFQGELDAAFHSGMQRPSAWREEEKHVLVPPPRISKLVQTAEGLNWPVERLMASAPIGLSISPPYSITVTICCPPGSDPLPSGVY